MTSCINERMTRAYALAADETGQFQLAAAGYESTLSSQPADLEATLNLMVLYWQAAGLGPRLPGVVPEDFRKQAGSRLPALLEAAGHRFADSAEIRFWKKYLSAEDPGHSLEPSEYRRLLQEHPSYLEPAFVVFSQTAGAEAEPEAMRLLAQYAEQPTARGRYVTSMISTALRKQRWSATLD